MRSVYSQQVCTAQELFVDMLAAKFNMDRLEFRKKFAKLDKLRTVLDKISYAWEDEPAAGCRPGRRRLAGAQAGHGLPGAARLPPRDRESQGVQSDHRPSGHPGGLRHRAGEGRRQSAGNGSADPGRVPRRRGVRTDGQPAPRGRSLPRGQLGQLRLHPAVERAPRQARRSTSCDPDPNEKPAGQGETTVPAARAATACAYANAIGQMPTNWPVSHNQPLHFKPYPTVPPLPTY